MRFDLTFIQSFILFPAYLTVITWLANHMDRIRFVLPFNDVKEVNPHAPLKCIWSINNLGCLQIFVHFYCSVTLK